LHSHLLQKNFSRSPKNNEGYADLLLYPFFEFTLFFVELFFLFFILSILKLTLEDVFIAAVNGKVS